MHNETRSCSRHSDDAIDGSYCTGLGVTHTSTMMGRIFYSDAGMGHGTTDRRAAQWRASVHQYDDYNHRMNVQYTQTGDGVIHHGE